MKTIWKKGLQLVLVLCLLVSSITGCGKAADTSKKGEDKTTAATVDTSEKVDLVFYVMGDAPKDMQKVQDKINEILLDKINATVTFNFTTWTDWQTKYNMVLMSGEDVDLIYSANWIDYANLSKKNAFLPLDDMLETYAPDIKKLVSDDVWNQMKIDGSIYAVPSTGIEYTNSGVQYREDLRKKYNLPVPDSIENMQAYLEGVKANEPKQALMTPSVNTAAFDYSFGAALALQAKYGWVNQGPMYGLAAEYSNPSELINYWASDDFRTDMKLMKDWADKGFWSKSALSEAPSSDAFVNGQSVMIVEGQNAAKYIGSKATIATDHPDWEAAFIPYAKMNGVAYLTHPTSNATAIPTNSKNPERALMALNLLYTDQTLNRLIQYGIEGEHYTIDENGFYVPGEKNEDYKSESANTWNLRNPNTSLPKESDAELTAIFGEMGQIAAKTKTPDIDIFTGFVEDTAPYSAELAALSTVMTQYLAPIQAGLVPDVDKAIDEFLEKADQAGLAKIQEEYTKQWKAYCEEYGY